MNVFKIPVGIHSGVLLQYNRISSLGEGQNKISTFLIYSNRDFNPIPPGRVWVLFITLIVYHMTGSP